MNVTDAIGGTALLASALEGHAKCLSILLANGAAIDWQQNDGTTALMFAVQKHHVQLVKLLLEAGANPSLRSSNGREALIWAAHDGQNRILNMLLAAGADVNTVAHDASTPLMRAAQEGHLITAQILLAYNAKVNFVADSISGSDEYVSTALMRSVVNWPSDRTEHPEREAMIELLIGAGADVNLRTASGNSALGWVALHGHIAAAELLLVHGGDPLIQDRHGYTPRVRAMMAGKHEMEQLFAAWGQSTDRDVEEGVSWVSDSGNNSGSDASTSSSSSSEDEGGGVRAAARVRAEYAAAYGWGQFDIIRGQCMCSNTVYETSGDNIDAQCGMQAGEWAVRGRASAQWPSRLPSERASDRKFLSDLASQADSFQSSKRARETNVQDARRVSQSDNGA